MINFEVYNPLNENIMKKILFPTDFSEVANNAFVHALELAKVINGELILLHTFELPILDNQYFPENYFMIFESLQLAQFDMFKDEIPKLRAIAEQHKLGNIKLNHKLMDGDLVSNIKKTVKDEQIDFVVMGTSGASGWESFFLGSNTGSVVSAVSVPLLSVPLEAKYTKIENIGFTTRFRDKDKEALKIVLKIAKKTHATVKCLYVKTTNSDVNEVTVNQWKKEFENEPVQFSIIRSDDVEFTILDFISHKNIDVLAMVTYKKTFFTRLFSKSLTKQFSNHSSIPILALHDI